MTEKIRCTCGYCSTGCQLTVDLTKQGPLMVQGSNDYPVNIGKACPKGFQFLGHLNATDRARTPYMRDKDGKLVSVTWDVALKAFVDNFKRIKQKYGNEALAYLSTGQIVNEEHAFLGCLAKFGMGIIHGDGNTRQCMATAVTAYKQSFGWDAPPWTYKDFEESDVLVFFSSNPVVAHPIMWNRVQMNKNHPQIIVVDPRATETARKATWHIPVAPDTTLIFLYSIANILIQKGWIDTEYIQAHTTGFNEFKEHVAKFNTEACAQAVKITNDDMLKFAEIIHNGKRVSFYWMVGINQSHIATRTAQAIINLALMTGNIGRPGTGANSITGQCNAMGSRVFSNTTSLMAGHKFEDPSHRQKVAKILGIDEKLIPPKLGMPYNEILDAVADGKIKGLWVVCTNPAHSWINSNQIPKVVKNLEFLVVQDLFYTTETAQLAHLILPAAGVGEKYGTLINSERRIGVVQKVYNPPGEAIPDFYIFQRIAKAWGCDNLFTKWTDPESVFNIIKQLTRNLPWDFTGIDSYKMILDQGGIQWPYPAGSPYPPTQERRLLEDGKYFHEDGKAEFKFIDYTPPPELPNEEFPFILMTGRGSVAQWHTQTRTSKVPILQKMSSKEPYVEISIEDAIRLNIQNNQWVVVWSRRGSIEAIAHVGNVVQPSEVFMPMHYVETNKLTYPAFDEFSKQPMYKYAAVAVNIKPK